MLLDMPSLDNCTVILSTLKDRYEAWEGVRPDFAPHATPEEYRMWYDRRLKADFGKDDRWLGWKLVERGTVGPVLSSLETVRRDAWMKDDEGNLERTSVYGIINVYTPRNYRLNGYATRLLRTIHYLIALPQSMPEWPVAWGSPPHHPEEVKLPPSLLSYLSSVAPPGFYAKAYIGSDAEKRPGWQDRPTTENSQLVGSLAFDLSSPSFTELGYQAIEMLYDDLPALGEQSSITERAALASTPVLAGKTIFRVDPNSPGTLAFAKWHKLLGGDRFPELDTSKYIHGVRLVPTGRKNQEYEADDPICLFIPHSLRDGELLITYVSGWDGELVQALLVYLRDLGQAMTMRCDGMRVWGLGRDHPFVQLFCEYGGKYGHRCEDNENRFHPVGVAWYGDVKEEGLLGEVQGWADL